MKRKLMLLNLGLGVLLLGGLFELRRQVRAAQDRYEIFGEASASQSVAALPGRDPLANVLPAEHLPVVERLLFSPDRNPIVEVQAPAPPEPVHRPDLPLLVGIMDFGQGPIALMAPDPQAGAKPVAVGEKVGEYVFLAAGAEKITLEWQGQSFELLHSELTSQPDQSKTAAVRQTREARRPNGAGASKAAVRANATEKESSSLGGKYGIGREIRPGVYAGDAKDTSPAGTEYQGYVKRVRRTPFGATSWWEKKGDTGESKP